MFPLFFLLIVYGAGRNLSYKNWMGFLPITKITKFTNFMSSKIVKGLRILKKSSRKRMNVPEFFDPIYKLRERGKSIRPLYIPNYK